MNNQNIYDEFRREVSMSINSLLHYLTIAVPANQQDAKMLSIGKDMLETMVEDIKGPGINDVFDMDTIVENWEDISSKFRQGNEDIGALMNDIMETYGEHFDCDDEV